MKPKTLTILSVLVYANFSLAQTDLIFKAGFEFISRLNDTGITWAGDNPSGNNINCTSNITSPQDCNIGRDADPLTNSDEDGHAGFSFTKLDTVGVPLEDQSVDYTTNSWACVRDNVTSLVWEVKTTTPGIHNEGNSYKWGGITAIGFGYPGAEGIYYNDWSELINGSNAGDGLCGFNNWRVPTAEELSGLANLGAINYNPAIDRSYFPNLAYLEVWSSSPISFGDTGAWIVKFQDGLVEVRPRHSFYHVWLVRSP